MTIDPRRFSVSQVVGILSFLSSITTLLVGIAGYLPTKYAASILSVTAIINAFTERVHGGLTKLEYRLANNEITKKEIVEKYIDKFEG